MTLSPTLVSQVAWCSTVGWYGPATQFPAGSGEEVCEHSAQGAIMQPLGCRALDAVSAGKCLGRVLLSAAIN